MREEKEQSKEYHNCRGHCPRLEESLTLEGVNALSALNRTAKGERKKQASDTQLWKRRHDQDTRRIWQIKNIDTTEWNKRQPLNVRGWLGPWMPG